jgi:hypothetical protein
MCGLPQKIKAQKIKAYGSKSTAAFGFSFNVLAIHQ